MNLVQVATSLQDLGVQHVPAAGRFPDRFYRPDALDAEAAGQLHRGNLHRTSPSMGTELTLDIGTLYAFLLVLARVSGAFIFVPLPGIKAGPEVARAVLAVSLTLALVPALAGDRCVRSEHHALDRLDSCRSRHGPRRRVWLSPSLRKVFRWERRSSACKPATPLRPPSIRPPARIRRSCSPSRKLAAGLLFFATGLDRQILLAVRQSLSSQAAGPFRDLTIHGQCA